MPRTPDRAAPGGYFGELIDPVTYKAALYHLLALPLALLYFFPLVLGFVSGVGLLVVVVGALALVAVLWLVLLFADIERALGTALLGVDLPRPPRPLHTAGLWDWVKSRLSDAGTYKALLYLLLKFPFSLLMYALGGALLGASAALLLAPLAGAFGLQSLPLSIGNALFSAGPLSVWLLSLCGVALLVFSLALLNVLSRGWAFLALALLTDYGEGAVARQDVQALQRGAQLVAYSGDLKATLDELLSQGLGATAASGALVLRDGARLAAQGHLPDDQTLYAVLAHQDVPQPGQVRLSRWPDGMLVSTPLAGSEAASLHAAFGVGRDPSAREVQLWASLADQAAVALRTELLLRAAQQQGSEQERARLARELHDSVAQALYGISLGARTARAQLEISPQRAAEALDFTARLADGAASEMKSLLFALRPDALQEGGLTPALARLSEMLQARYRLASRFTASEEPQLSDAVKGAVYRIAQEAAHNAVKHAHASRIDLSLGLLEGAWQLAVTDDGQGFDPAAQTQGSLGLKSMRERAAEIGATLDIHSQPGQGTRLSLTLPSQAFAPQQEVSA